MNTAAHYLIGALFGVAFACIAAGWPMWGL